MEVFVVAKAEGGIGACASLGYNTIKRVAVARARGGESLSLRLNTEVVRQVKN
jgi:citrate lyase synthetase